MQGPRIAVARLWWPDRVRRGGMQGPRIAVAAMDPGGLHAIARLVVPDAKSALSARYGDFTCKVFTFMARHGSEM